MMSRVVLTVFAAAFLSSLAPSVAAQDRVTIDFENGAAFSGYNDVRIPGNTGTLFSLTDDLRSDTTYFYRVRASVRLAPKHVVSALASPLRVNASGAFNRAIFFQGATFEPGTPVAALYVFNSYGLTYRYEFVQTANWRFGIGATGKVRDAVMRLESAGQRAEKTNLGFVPLVNVLLEPRLAERLTLRLDGDALAAPQGRAEDVFAGVLVKVNRHVSVKAGYRVLEGGADNDEVYTFALFHYAAVGVLIRF